MFLPMSNLYETEKVRGEYLLFHYGSNEETLGERERFPLAFALGFPARTARYFSQCQKLRGLDLGCAVGRSTFEMSRTCSEVVGIDFSQAFIHTADALARGETVCYERLEEAHHKTPLFARLPGGAVPQRVHFETGDAMNLRSDLGEFDRVHAANLLCRLAEPQRLLQRLPSLVKGGGELVLATPCTWLAEFTPPRNWPSATTVEWLKSILGPHFDLACEAEEPFLIRETARKFQLTFSLVTVWRRKL